MYGFQDVLDAHDFLTCDKKNLRGYSITRQVAVLIGPEQAGEGITLISDIAPTVLVRGHVRMLLRQVTLVNPGQDDLLTITEVVKIYGHSRESWRRKCSDGKIRCAVKRGKSWFIPKTFLDAQFSAYNRAIGK